MIYLTMKKSNYIVYDMRLHRRPSLLGNNIYLFSYFCFKFSNTKKKMIYRSCKSFFL